MTITIGTLLSVCAAFSAVCLAAGYLIKIYKLAKKPIELRDDKIEALEKSLKQDQKDIKRLDAMVKGNTECLELLLSSTLAILGHLELGNHTNEMKNERQKIQAFLTSKATN